LFCITARGDKAKKTLIGTRKKKNVTGRKIEVELKTGRRGAKGAEQKKKLADKNSLIAMGSVIKTTHCAMSLYPAAVLVKKGECGLIPNKKDG